MSMPNSAQPKKKFLDQVRDVLRMKHYSYRTEQSYSQWIKRFILFHELGALAIIVVYLLGIYLLFLQAAG